MRVFPCVERVSGNGLLQTRLQRVDRHNILPFQTNEKMIDPGYTESQCKVPDPI